MLIIDICIVICIYFVISLIGTISVNRLYKKHQLNLPQKITDRLFKPKKEFIDAVIKNDLENANKWAFILHYVFIILLIMYSIIITTIILLLVKCFPNYVNYMMFVIAVFSLLLTIYLSNEFFVASVLSDLNANNKTIEEIKSFFSNNSKSKRKSLPKSKEEEKE